MKRIVFCICLSIVLLLGACAKPVTTAGTDLMKGIRGSGAVSAEPPADNMDFSIELLKTVYNGENTVISPVSAYICLSMVANGAAGSTLTEFENVLGAPVADLNDSCASILAALNRKDNGVELKSVNGIWYDSSDIFTPNKEFLQTNADYYNAAAVASDFSDSRTVDDINRFVETNTNGLIPEMLKELDPNDVMVLINTLYFDGTWENPFQPESTADRSFILAGGKTIETPTMMQTFDSVRYLDDGHASGIILPYQEGRFAFVCILPDDKATSEYVDTLTAERFNDLIRSATERRIDLFLPKFEMTGDYFLNDMLKQMGINLAFDMTYADFSSMGSGGLFLSLVRQKIVFELNENGTKAAAATEAIMSTTMPVEHPDAITLKFDRPFVYALMDMETGTPLFMGVMGNPKG